MPRSAPPACAESGAAPPRRPTGPGSERIRAQPLFGAHPKPRSNPRSSRTTAGSAPRPPYCSGWLDREAAAEAPPRPGASAAPHPRTPAPLPRTPRPTFHDLRGLAYLALCATRPECSVPVAHKGASIGLVAPTPITILPLWHPGVFRCRRLGGVRWRSAHRNFGRKNRGSKFRTFHEIDRHRFYAKTRSWMDGHTGVGNYPRSSLLTPGGGRNPGVSDSRHRRPATGPSVPPRSQPRRTSRRRKALLSSRCRTGRCRCRRSRSSSTASAR